MAPTASRACRWSPSSHGASTAMADSGRMVPVTDYDNEPPDDVYAIRQPDGSFRFPDGERCDNESALLARFRKRLED